MFTEKSFKSLKILFHICNVSNKNYQESVILTTSIVLISVNFVAYAMHAINVPILEKQATYFYLSQEDNA